MNTPKSVFKHVTPYFLILGVISFLGLIVSDVFDVDSRSTIFSIISIALSVAVIIMSIAIYRNKELGGGITYGKAFTVGFLTFFMANVVYMPLFLLYTTVISPSYMDILMEREMVKVEERMLEQNPDMTNQQIEQAQEMSKMFMTPVMMSVMIVIMGAVMGAILSLIISIFLMKKGGINHALENDSLDNESLE